MLFMGRTFFDGNVSRSHCESWKGKNTLIEVMNILNMRKKSLTERISQNFLPSNVRIIPRKFQNDVFENKSLNV